MWGVLEGEGECGRSVGRRERAYVHVRSVGRRERVWAECWKGQVGRVGSGRRGRASDPLTSDQTLDKWGVLEVPCGESWKWKESVGRAMWGVLIY